MNKQSTEHILFAPKMMYTFNADFNNSFDVTNCSFQPAKHTDTQHKQLYFIAVFQVAPFRRRGL
jgi:hypothetical protein